MDIRRAGPQSARVLAARSLPGEDVGLPRWGVGGPNRMVTPQPAPPLLLKIDGPSA